MIERIKQWYHRCRTRRALLTMPGVDLLVRRVMDQRYGKHGWRVRYDWYSDTPMLEAQVSLPDRTPCWLPIGPLNSIDTREWLRAGGRPPELSHAKVKSIPKFVNTYPLERKPK